MTEYIVPIDDLKAIVEGRDVRHDLKILVRCKECKYYNGEYKYCVNDVFVKPNGYCSFAERKEE